MSISRQQAHVLENLNRVLPLFTKTDRARYHLDGVECTAQITGLTVKKLIAKHSSGGFSRLAAKSVKESAHEQRQLPLSNTIELMRASLAAPHAVRVIGKGRR